MKPFLLTAALLFSIFWSSAQNWEQLTIPTTQDIVSSSFVSDTEGWIGYKNATSTATIYHTTDGGASWNPISVPGSSPGSSYVCFVTSSTGYVVISDKAYKTVNGGSTWTQISLPGEPVYEPFFLNENTGFIAGKGEVFKTIDGGNQWIAYPDVKLKDMHFLNDSVGFGSHDSFYLWSTTNGGESWEFISDINGCCYDYYAVYYNPAGYLTYTGSGENVFGEYSSFIGGNAFSIYGDSYTSEVIGSLLDLKWYDSNRGYAAGKSGIVVFTEDGGHTWDEINLCELFNLSPASLLALDGFETVYVFGAGGIGFKHSAECPLYSQFNYTVDDLTVQFINQSLNATSWFWDFDDGTTSTLQHPAHTYSSDGAYNVCLIASNDTCGEMIAEDCQNLQLLICTSNTSQNAAGSVDSTFSDDGIATIHFDGSYSECHSLAIQADHKVVGSNYGLGSEIIRYKINGEPDSTFNGDGITKLNDHYKGSQVKLSSSGRILVAGGNNLSGSTISITSFNPDGTLTSSFGNNGVASIDPAGIVSEIFRGMEILPDDKILVLTSSGYGGDYYVQITRLNPDGSIDSSFALDGITKLASKSFTFHDNDPGGFLTGPDGKIIVAGKINQPLNKLAVARLNADGTMDSTFDGDGFAETDLPSGQESDYAADVAIQQDGKIVVAGSSLTNTFYGFMAVVRYNIDGSLDHTFGNNGILEIQPGNYEATGKAVAIQPDGKILACGLTIFNLTPPKILLVKLNTDGSYDTSFGNNGFVQTSLNCEETESFDMAIDEDKVYVGGGAPQFKNFCIVRYNNESCTAPTSLSASNITSSSAKLTWNEISLDDRYQVRYKAAGTSTWTNISTVNNFKKISSLAPETKYTWQVKSICSDNPVVSSDWSVKQFFTTKSLKPAGEIALTALEVYPNPFTSATTIAFSLPDASNIKIDLTDLSGRKIKTIAAGNFEAGNCKFILQKENLDAGVYVLRLETSTGFKTEKLIVE